MQRLLAESHNYNGYKFCWVNKTPYMKYTSNLILQKLEFNNIVEICIIKYKFYHLINSVYKMFLVNWVDNVTKLFIKEPTT